MGINVLTPTTTALYSRSLIDEPALWQRDWEPTSPGISPQPPEGWLTMGQVIESFDKLRFFHKKTKNRETRYHGAARFDLDLDNPVIRRALLVYVVSSRTAHMPNSYLCCNAPSQISAVSRLVEPIQTSANFEAWSSGTRTDLKRIGSVLEVGVTSDTPFFNRTIDQVDAPADAEAQGGTSMTGFDVTGIVRGWLADPATNLGVFLHAGVPDMTQYPYRRAFGNLGSGNFRRRKHWVRQDQFSIGGGQYRFVCLSHVAPYLIVET